MPRRPECGEIAVAGVAPMVKESLGRGCRARSPRRDGVRMSDAFDRGMRQL